MIRNLNIHWPNTSKQRRRVGTRNGLGNSKKPRLRCSSTQIYSLMTGFFGRRIKSYGLFALLVHGSGMWHGPPFSAVRRSTTRHRAGGLFRYHQTSQPFTRCHARRVDRLGSNISVDQTHEVHWPLSRRSLSRSPCTMTAEVFVKNGVEIRSFKSGRCVREDEWTQFVYVNNVRSPYVSQAWRSSDIRPGPALISYARKRTIREAPYPIPTRLRAWSPPSQAKPWFRDSQRARRISSGSPQGGTGKR